MERSTDFKVFLYCVKLYSHFIETVVNTFEKSLGEIPAIQFPEL